MPVKHEFTTHAYLRDHGASPRGIGRWGFLAVDSRMPRYDDLIGDIIWTPESMTLTEAKAWVKKTQPAGLYAILP